MLEVDGLVAGYGPIAVLHGIDLRVAAGETLAIVGANGAGKTTLLRTLSGLLPLQGGRIVFDGVDVSRQPAHALARSGLLHVPEGRKIFKPMDVRSNLEVGACCRRDGTARSRAEDLERMFTLFPRLRERAGQAAGTLSGGEQQMVAIGRALMGRPRMLLLDEPSLGLAPLVIAEIFDVLRRVNAEGTAIILVEQNIRLALRTAQRPCVLQTGRVILEGPSDQVLRTDLLRDAYLGGTVASAERVA